jgi:CheY-like chemotaxis protein
MTDPVAAANRKRVQVADDNADVRQLWRAYLTVTGYDVSAASNGKEAIERAIAELPDVILMDFSMPGMDGADAARALKADARTAGIPVVGLTAHGIDASAHAFHEVCAVVLEKPLRPEAVLTALGRALQPG